VGFAAAAAAAAAAGGGGAKQAHHRPTHPTALQAHEGRCGGRALLASPVDAAGHLSFRCER
jgi:hypothetical protein